MELPKLSQFGSLSTESINPVLTLLVKKRFFTSSENKSIKILRYIGKSKASHEIH